MDTEKSRPVGVLFVCSTNTSLSPLIAAVFARDAAAAGYAEAFSVSSAGSHAGKTARQVDRKTRQIAEARGLLIPDTLSRPIVAADIPANDLIVVVNEDCFWRVKHIAPSITATKLRLLMEFSGQLALRELPDPLLGEITYEAACDEILKVSPKLLQDCLASFAMKSCKTR